MKKVELEIVALSNNIPQTNSYAVILGELNGNRRLPIVIGAYEAQAIAVSLERMKPSRPLTHDLFANFMLAFHIELQEIIIYRLDEGVFYSKLICNSGKDTIELDSRTSDALALAVRAGCPIYTKEEVIDAIGFYMDQNDEAIAPESKNITVGEEVADTSSTVDSNFKNMTLEELEDLLQHILDQEDYVQAIAVRDEINKRKK